MQEEENNFPGYFHVPLGEYKKRLELQEVDTHKWSDNEKKTLRKQLNNAAILWFRA